MARRSLFPDGTPGRSSWIGGEGRAESGAQAAGVERSILSAGGVLSYRLWYMYALSASVLRMGRLLVGMVWVTVRPLVARLCADPRIAWKAMDLRVQVLISFRSVCFERRLGGQSLSSAAGALRGALEM